MITDALTKRGNAATTSDRWHVIHVKWCGKEANHPPYARTVVSEHPSRQAAVVAAKLLSAKLDPVRKKLPILQRDQILVRPPRYRSLKFASHRAERRQR